MAIKIIFTPEVDQAILHHLDFVDISEIPQTLNSIEDAKIRLEKTLSTFPLSGSRFQNASYYYPVKGYVFIYEFDHKNDAVNILDIRMPGENWINR